MSTREVCDGDVALAMALGEAQLLAGGDYLFTRRLFDGRKLFLLRWRAHGVQLSVGLGDGFFTDTWIYDVEQADAGWRAAIGWDGEGEPEGWYRHPQSGRRRDDGDASKEYVQR